METKVFTFRVPVTMLRGNEGHRRLDQPSHALNVVQPYPNLSGLKKKRAAPINFGPLPERLLKRPKAGDVKAGDVDTGSVNAEKAPAEEAPRHFGPVKVLARKVLKDKAKGKAVAPEAKGKPLAFVETGESARGKESLAAYEPQMGAAEEAHYGDQEDNATNAVRKARRAVGRYFKAAA